MSSRVLKLGMLAAGFAAALGCGQEGPIGDLPVAEVGDERITLAQLRRFEAALPAHLRSDSPDGRRQHLQSLIDRLLMRLEAEAAGLDQVDAVQRKMTEISAQRLSEEVIADHVTAAVEYTEEDLMEAYERFDLGWEVWPAHIQSETEEEARAIIAAAKAGEDFLDLGRRLSRADDAERGGDLGKFFSPVDAIPALRQGTFHLEVGDVSDPIETKDGFEVIKILDKRRLSFAQMRPDIAKQMHQRKWGEVHAAKIAELKERWQLSYHPDGIEQVWPEAIDPDQAEMPVFSYRGGAFSVSECRYLFDKIRRKGGAAPDSAAALIRHLDIHVTADTLFVLLGREEGRDQRPEFSRWYAGRREETMIEYLFASRISAGIKVEPAEARAYYEKHIDTYRELPGDIEVTEVLVATRAKAEEIMARAQAGENLNKLAHDHSLRSTLKPFGGHTFADSGRGRIGSLFLSPDRRAGGGSNSRDVGRLMGPLPFLDYFSVYRLDKAVEMKPVPFRQYRKPIAAQLRKQKEGPVFAAYLDSLRQANASRTRIYQDNLAISTTDGE